MRKFAWCTDVHLDFLDREGRNAIKERFLSPISRAGFEGLIVTGDVSLSDDIVRHLDMIDQVLNVPVYFVLGNHDFYGSSFEEVRRRVQAFCMGSVNMKYMTGAGHISLSSSIAIVGDDGWYDARYGDPHTSSLVMSDWLRITDYSRNGAMRVNEVGLVPHRKTIVGISRKFADEAAERVKTAVSNAAETHRTVVVLTHVPPWPKAHKHSRKTNHIASHPWYTSKATGDAIESVAAEHPNVKFEVFCGHTHGKADLVVSHNITCHVGGSEYGSPRVAGTIILP